jgi:hypothetical protein
LLRNSGRFGTTAHGNRWKVSAARRSRLENKGEQRINE